MQGPVLLALPGAQVNHLLFEPQYQTGQVPLGTWVIAPRFQADSDLCLTSDFMMWYGATPGTAAVQVLPQQRRQDLEDAMVIFLPYAGNDSLRKRHKVPKLSSTEAG